METVADFIIFSSKMTTDSDCSHEIKRRLLLEKKKKKHDKPRQCVKKQIHYFAYKGPSSQSYSFSSIHVQMWALDHKEGWETKNWHFPTVVLEKSWEFLGLQGDQSSNSKGNQPWILTGRTDAEAEAPIIWPPDAKSKLTIKDADAEKDWGQEEKGVTEDEMVECHHWLNGHEF